MTHHDDVAAKKVPRAPMLVYVDTGTDPRPKDGVTYPVIPASADDMASKPAPAPGNVRLDLNFNALFAGNMPDFRTNEGMLSAQIRTQVNGTEFPASRVVNFEVNDSQYAGGFESSGAFSNITFATVVDLRIRLVEVDGRFRDGFNKVSKIVKDSGLLKIDALKGVPYLDLGTKIVEGVVQEFGQNTDDLLWDETLRLDLDPVPGSAFLREGIYALIDRPDEYADMDTEVLRSAAAEYSYKDRGLLHRDQPLRVTHFIFGVKIRS